jgi:hypothetical protein
VVNEVFPETVPPAVKLNALLILLFAVLAALNAACAESLAAVMLVFWYVLTPSTNVMNVFDAVYAVLASAYADCEYVFTALALLNEAVIKSVDDTLLAASYAAAANMLASVARSDASAAKLNACVAIPLDMSSTTCMTEVGSLFQAL